MARAFDPKAITFYTPEQDALLPVAERAIFQVRHLTIFEDAALEAERDAKKWTAYEYAFEIVRRCVVSWDNLLGADGSQVRPVAVDGKLTDESLVSIQDFMLDLFKIARRVNGVTAERAGKS